MLVVVLGFGIGCNGGNGDDGQPIVENEDTVTDYSGDYYITVASERAWVMNINQVDSDVLFSIVREIDYGDVAWDGTGTVTGNTMNLTAEGNSQLTISITFSDDGESFSGTLELTGVDYPAVGTITGNKEKWETYDVDVNGIPQFATADCIELDKIGRVSKFRSGAGHDYSDDFESCRSMKHYYEPKSGVDFSSVRIFSPVGGTVIGTMEEFDGSLSKGTLVDIQVQGYPAFVADLYHIDLTTPLAIGDVVVAGQELGTSAKDDGTAFDMAFGVNTPNGYRRLSFFYVMTDPVFAVYQARGMTSRDDAIITKEERDADPLSPCDGSEFVDRGTLENWVTLSD